MYKTLSDECTRVLSVSLFNITKNIVRIHHLTCDTVDFFLQQY